MMRLICCRVRAPILCMTVLLCWAVMVTVIQVQMSYQHVHEKITPVPIVKRNLSIPPEVYDIKDKISRIANNLYRAKKHVRGSKTSDYLKDAIEIIDDVLQDLKIDKTPLAERKTVTAKSVCPEEYKSTTFGYPFFYEGFVVTNCSYAKPIWELVTLVNYIKFTNDPTIGVAFKVNKITAFVSSVYELYPNIALVLATDHNADLTGVQKQFPNLKLTNPDGQGDGSVWKSVVEEVKTPYVFMARNIDFFTNDSRLERLVREVESLQVSIAGGAVRTPDGHWSKGCFQSVHRNFTLKYLEGYDESLHECLFCDYIIGPFLAKTEIMKKYPITQFDVNAGLFEEWFLRIGKFKQEPIVCPDAMFHINTIVPESSDWDAFMSAWNLQKIVTVQGQTLISQCKLGFSMYSSKALSHCALKANADVVKQVMASCQEAGIICELQEGTSLGAVKFGKILPWERDADITFLSGNYSAFQRLEPKFEENGIRFKDLGSQWCCADNRTAGGKFAINNGWNVELYGQHMMDSELLLSAGLKPTQILLDGMWVNVPRNPGLFTRNRYGHEIYRHALHWMTTGDSTGWINYKTNTFMKCSDSGDHDCLDRYNADGNLPFTEPLP